MLASSDIAMVHHPLACGFYSIINLFRLRGFLEPDFQHMARTFQVWKEPAQVSVTPFDQLRLLICYCFPALCAVGGLPVGMTAGEIFPALLDSGCHIIAGFTWRKMNGELMHHSVVIESFDGEGFTVLDSTGGYAEGSKIELEPTFTPEYLREHNARKEAHSHGSRRLLPFLKTQTLDDPLGMHVYFVFAFPLGTEGTQGIAS